ncbi:MAG: tetratricopeptide repeat protein [Candidatus Aminicenantes bacterium]|nr:tetratricopeptide repeat protein [Candidatus Aminicenantes bacterium]
MKKPLALFMGFVLLAFCLVLGSNFAQEMYLEENRACNHLEKGEVDEAILLLKRKLRRYPNNFDCHLYLGLAYYLQGDFETSMKTLNKVEFETERLGKAKATLQAGKRMDEFSTEDAYLAQSGGLVFTKGRRGVMKFALGMLYRKKENFNNASTRFSEALKYKYPEIEARKQLLVVHCRLKEYKKARKQFDKIIKAGEISDELRFLEGFVGNYLKDEAKAIENFSKTSEVFPEAKRNLATVYYNQGKYDKSLVIWESILEEQPEDRGALLSAARAHFHVGQKEKAQEYFDKMRLTMKVEKYSPKKLPLILVDFYQEVQFDFQCKVSD